MQGILALSRGVKDSQREKIELHVTATGANLSRKPNFLIHETSPYLKDHAFNPVEWRPWGDEALKKAKNDGKPIFLSIGYSTCHWCHQLARESFEDEKTAAIINKNFIPIKVDREERPEIDAYYMKAVQAMTGGGGGWPLSVFLTPDLKPFYGGTYFPPEPRYGMPSFRQVLQFVADLWREKRDSVLKDATQVAQVISLKNSSETGATELTHGALDDGYSALVSSFDPAHGGFGGPPKFPMPLSSSFLLRYHYRTGKELALRSVTKTLDSMMLGGIRDHLGGGFHRYSTDRLWLVPHFEKMLYDNAQLAKLYAEAYQVTGKPEYIGVAEDTLEWLLREMRKDGRGNKGGGLFSAQDADTSEGEGTYYTWTPGEVEEVLGKDSALKFCELFGVTNTGNFEGRSILHLAGVQHAALMDEATLAGWKSKLYEARAKRPRPATDTKVLTSWNGLAISALAFVGAVSGKAEYLTAGEKAATFILVNNLAPDGGLLRRYAEGEAALEGTLEDYAFFVQGLVDLFEATGAPKWLAEASRLATVMVDRLEDKGGGGFFLTVDAVPARLKEDYDGVMPSGNSVAALDLIRLSELTGNQEMRKAAERALRAFGSEIDRQPSAHAAMLSALDMLLNGMVEIVITSKERDDAAMLLNEVWRRFVPNKVVLTADLNNFAELAKITELLRGRKPGQRPLAYVCRNSTCQVPAETADVLAAQLAHARG
ncbi:MAG TPA: thioredoxin domain-containing protein [Nitrososphaerales archaeon]|nr:thioredoxin domain-containing protein [Nitrososphaerales archaeon]